MSIRIKAFLVITAIVGVITASCLAFSIFFSQTQILKTIEKDMLLAASLADEVVTIQVDLLIANASKAALHLAAVPDEDLPAALEEQMASYADFAGMSVFDPSGIAQASTIPVPPPEEMAVSVYVKRVLAGESIITTTRLDPSGAVVFRVVVPIDNGRRILGVTIPGLFFSNILSKFTIWETGSIFMVDEEGVIIAGQYTDRVLERRNIIEEGKKSPRWASMGAFIAAVIGSDPGASGVGWYTINGEERVSAYWPVTGRGVNWRLMVSAPITESPATQVEHLLFIGAALFFGLGLLAAFFASANIAAPFQQIQEQNLRLEELRDLAQSASETKSQFLANMSHEMRTPLNAVIGISELSLGGPDLPPDIEDNLEKIYNSGITLLGIVNDLLDISKIESGKFELVPAEYELPSLINDTISLNIIRIGSKPISFKLLIDETLPSRLLGDELRIKQIFNNLLSNAFKYTMEGVVILRIASQEEDGAVWLTASVEDSGIGIKEGDKEKLFADYKRLDLRKTHALEGTGLGLAITKKMVELMEGTISVESEYGKGSTFTIRIKQQSLNAAPIGTQAADNLMKFRYSVQKRNRNSTLARIQLPSVRVLVVDDMVINLDVAWGLLQSYGMKVNCVTGGEQAVDLIRDHKVHFDAIFMDHMMPGMDGLEAIRIIREEIGTEYAQKIPIIVLTANAIAGSEEMFLSRGFNDFLSKPIDILRLDAVIHRWIRV